MLPQWVDIVTSHGFLILACTLYYAGYPIRTVLGQLCQYCLSTLIWTSFVSTKILWMDRTIAILNIVSLGLAHVQQGILMDDIWPALCFTISFKLVDWSVCLNGCSLWYFWWHFNLLANNVSIVMTKKTIPIILYVIQHGVAVLMYAQKGV